MKLDMRENKLLNDYPGILEILLVDRTTGKNILWATDDYKEKGFGFFDSIDIESVSGKNDGIIMPRVEKEKDLQTDRSKSMAEVFTPSWVVNIQNNKVDDGWFGLERKRFNTEKEKSWITNYYKVCFPEKLGKGWRDYVCSPRLEVSCGEAPYITSRYDAVSGKYLKPKVRVGLLDRKLRVISENVTSESEWVTMAKEALKSIYGFEWQGDNILLARENVLLAVLEYFEYYYNKKPNIDDVIEYATIISWNIWQMDGIKCVIPLSCHDETKSDGFDLLTGEEVTHIEKCPGCVKENRLRHNGIYPIIMDWNANKTIRFVEIVGDQKNAKL